MIKKFKAVNVNLGGDTIVLTPTDKGTRLMIYMFEILNLLNCDKEVREQKVINEGFCGIGDVINNFEKTYHPIAFKNEY